MENQINNRVSQGIVEEKGLPLFQKTILSTILVLFFLIVIDSVLALIDSYFVMFLPDYWTSTAHTSLLYVVYSVFPLRDLFIAILFAYLYYYRGMKDREKDREAASFNFKNKMFNTL